MRKRSITAAVVGVAALGGSLLAASPAFADAVQNDCYTTHGMTMCVQNYTFLGAEPQYGGGGTAKLCNAGSFTNSYRYWVKDRTTGQDLTGHQLVWLAPGACATQSFQVWPDANGYFHPVSTYATAGSGVYGTDPVYPFGQP